MCAIIAAIIVAKAWVYKRGGSTFVVLWRDISAKLRSKTLRHRRSRTKLLPLNRKEAVPGHAGRSGVEEPAPVRLFAGGDANDRVEGRLGLIVAVEQQRATSCEP
jgi:hypothetical protein